MYVYIYTYTHVVKCAFFVNTCDVNYNLLIYILT